MAKELKDLSQEELKTYIINKDLELETDRNERVNGIKNSTASGYIRAGYLNLRKFYEGDQWDTLKEKNRNIRVYNYTRTIVDNYVSLLSPPEISYPSRDITSELENLRSETITKVLQDINQYNDFTNKFRLAVLNGSVLGDSFIIGPYLKAVNVKGKISRMIAFDAVKRPENIRVIWADDNFDEIFGYIIHIWISVEKAKRLFADEIREKNIILTPSAPPSGAVTAEPVKNNQMVEVIQYYDDTYHMTLLQREPIRFQKHDWGFVPLIYIPANLDPYRPWGISDIEDVLDPQKEYNESVSLGRDINDLVGIPPVFSAGASVNALQEVLSGAIQIVDIGENGKVFPSPFTANPQAIMQYGKDRKEDISNVSMINDIFWGGERLGKMSGRALSVIMQPINKKIVARQERWTSSLKKLYANTLHLLEIEVPKFKKLIDGAYEVDVFFSDTFVRSVVDELNKFNAKTQSLYTTMKNTGIESPTQEIERMKEEYKDPELMAEISRNPALHLQLAQAAATPVQGGTGTPMMTEENNQPTAGENVVAAPGQPSPVSSTGAVNLNNFRG